MLTHPGVYCLRTNQTDWDESTLWRTYFTLTDIEAVFRSLKSELGLRPIYHHKPSAPKAICSSPSSPINSSRWFAGACAKPVSAPVGPPFAESSKGSSASPPPSDAPTARLLMAT